MNEKKKEKKASAKKSEKKVKGVCFSEAIELIMEKGFQMRLPAWPADKRLAFEAGKFMLISNKRGIDAISNFTTELATNNNWVKFDET